MTNKPFFTTAAVVNWMLERSHKDRIQLSPMSLQTMLYLSLGYCLAVTDRPVMDEMCSAWHWGPVFPSVYCEYKRLGSLPIPYSEYYRMTDYSHETGTFSEPIATAYDSDSEEGIAVLEEAWRKYSDMNDRYPTDTPWLTTLIKAKSSGMKSLEIPMEDIRQHFIKYIGEQEEL